MRSRLYKIYKSSISTWNNFSFDVSLGSLAGGSLAIHLTGGIPPVSWWFLLPLTVWIIYTIDHLFDAYRVGETASTHRHIVHHRHSKYLIPVVIVSGFFLPVLAFFTFPFKLFFAGVILGTFSGLHLLASFFLSARSYPKEPVIAILYASGLWFIPVLVSSNIRFETITGFILLFIAALLNLLLFSYMDFEIDLTDGHSSFATAYGKQSARYTIIILSILGTLVSLFFIIFFTQFMIAGIVLLILNAFPGIAAYYDAFFSFGEKYRYIGDSLFILNFIPFFMDFLDIL